MERAEFVDWLKEITVDEKMVKEFPTNADRVKWYLAYSDAEAMADETTKSLARKLMDGIPSYEEMEIDDVVAEVEILFDESFGYKDFIDQMENFYSPVPDPDYCVKPDYYRTKEGN